MSPVALSTASGVREGGVGWGERGDRRGARTG